MAKSICKGYSVEFSLEGLTLAEQNQIYHMVMDNLSFSLKDKLSIKVIDLIGGTHDILNDTGITPEGEKCLNCKMIDCQECSKYKKGEKGK